VVTVSKRQPSSDSFGIVRQPRPDELQFVDPSQLSRYDLLLVVIPLLLLFGVIVGQVTGVPLWAAIAAAALSALPLVADGLAINPPR
jgi:hypothetical protein